MIASNVIIITSGHYVEGNGRKLGEAISGILKLKKKPIVILGPDGDDLLRNCNEIENCEIVFDPNFDGGLFSSLKAGLFTVTHGAAFVISLGAPYLDVKNWSKLEAALLNSEKEHVIRAAPRAKNDEVNFPFIVTARGVSYLKNLPAETPWPPGHEVIFRDVLLDEAVAPVSTSL